MTTILWEIFTFSAPVGEWKIGRVLEVVQSSIYAPGLYEVSEIAGDKPIKIVFNPGTPVVKSDLQTLINNIDFSIPTASETVASIRQSAQNDLKTVPGLATATVAQAETYIDNNATDLAGVVVILKLIVRMLIALRNDRWPDIESR